MKTIIQRVEKASVSVQDECISNIGPGYVILLGIHRNDSSESIKKMIHKIVSLRLFSDDEKSKEKSIKDIDGDILLVSQFTLYAVCKKGNRPSFSKAAGSKEAKKLYTEFHSELEKVFDKKVATGKFGAHMKINLINDGPVTIVLDSDEL